MQDAQLISQAGLVESLASDGLVSVSTGAGQPQKNMELAKFADSLGSSVPLQQTSEQVSITGLYARTSDGKMVELTKESVASVMAGLMKEGKEFPYMYIDIVGTYGTIKDFDEAIVSGYYKVVGLDSSIGNAPTANEYGTLETIDAGDYIMQRYASRYGEVLVRHKTSESWYPWTRIDNFGYNTLAELSSGVAQQMGVLSSEVRGVNITSTVYLLNTVTSKFKSMVVGKYILKDSNGNISEKNFTENVDSAGYFGIGFQEGINAGSFVLLIYGGY